MSETKEEGAACKRKLVELQTDFSDKKSKLLERFDNIDLLLQMMREDPNWKWIPVCVGCNQEVIIWQINDSIMVVVEFNEYNEFDVRVERACVPVEMDPTDIGSEVLKHVDLLHRIYTAPGVKQLMAGLDEHDVHGPERKAVFEALWKWAKAYDDFKIIDVTTPGGKSDETDISIIVNNQQYYIKTELIDPNARDREFLVFVSHELAELPTNK